MAAEIQFQTSPVVSSGIFYAVVRNPTGAVWRTDTLVFETWVDGNMPLYAIPLTEQGTSGFYVGSFPTAVTTAGTYSVITYKQVGGTPAVSDTVEAEGPIVWGSPTTTSNTVTAGTQTATAYTDADLLAAFRQALYSMLVSGAKSYTINGRSFTRYDLKEIREMIAWLEMRIDSATQPGIAGGTLLVGLNGLTGFGRGCW